MPHSRFRIFCCVTLLGCPAIAAAQQVVVSAPFAQVKGDNRTLGRLAQGSVVNVESRSGTWLLVTLPGSLVRGWISEQDVRSGAAAAGIERLPDDVDALFALRDKTADQLKAAANDAARVPLELRLMRVDRKLMMDLENHLATSPETFTPEHAQQMRDLLDERFALSAIDVARRAMQAKRWAEAAGLYQELVDASVRHWGKSHYFTRDAQFQLAEAQAAVKRPPAEQAELERAGKLHDDAERLSDAGDYGQALTVIRQALAIQKARRGTSHLCYGQDRVLEGEILADLSRYAEAEAPIREGLTIIERTLGREHRDYTNTLSVLGMLYGDQGDYARALSTFEQAAEIIKTAGGERASDYATALNNLGFIHKAQGHYAQAEACYEQCLEVSQRADGEQSASYSRYLNNLAALYVAMGDMQRAEPLLIRALEIQRAVLGEGHPEYARTLSNCATFLQSAGSYSDAEAYFKQISESIRLQLGEDHPDYATSLGNLAILYLEQHKYDLAEPLLKRARDIDQRAFGEQSPRFASATESLADLYDRMGDLQQSIPLRTQAIELLKKTLGANHPVYALALNDRVRLQAQFGQWADALASADPAMRSMISHVRRILPGLSEAQQQDFLAHDFATVYTTALSLPVAADDQQAADISAEWVLNAKNLAVVALAERTRLARDASDPRLAETLTALAQARQELATLTLRPPPEAAAQEAHRERVAKLAEEETRLAKQLGRLQGNEVDEARWIPLAEVRAAIPDNAVLIEIARFDLYYFLQQHSGEPHYVAWVIPPAAAAQPVQVVDLGPADEIDAAVSGFQAALQKTGEVFVVEGEAAAERALASPLKQLSRLVLDPLQRHLQQQKRWLISPDAALWLMPWEALPVSAGRYAIEDHAVSYLISGRDLLSHDRSPHRTPGLIVADPDFDGSTGTTGSAQPQQTALRTRSGMPGRWERLFGTANEARDVLPLVAAYLHRPPAFWQRESAVESVVKQADRPQVAVLCTHGFFLPEPKESGSEAAPAAKEAAVPNPLLRCGLIFAGANHLTAAAPGSDDGVLTGMEIVGCDFRGTELVVLSACETGLGDVRNGQGVAGLRQAFQLAGAQAVVSSLWKVPDAETAELMQSFWRRLAAGDSRSAALHGAKLEMIERRRAAGSAAHPYFWAAFTVTGGE